MAAIELVNYKYLGIAIVFLIITYYYLERTKYHIKRKNVSQSHKSSIKILTDNGEIYMDPNIFEIHMNRLKDNIIHLHNRIDKSKCSKIKSYLDKSRSSTKQYIKMNNKDMNNSFCDISSHNNICDINMLKERELLKNKLSNKTEMSDNDDNAESDMLRYELLDLTIDIDIILFLVRSSLCKNGSLNLSPLDQVVLELYRTHCSASDDIENRVEPFKSHEGGVCNLNTPTPCYGGINNYHDATVNTRLNIAPESISKCVPTHDMADTAAMPVKETLKIKTKPNNNIIQSHCKEKDFKCNQVKLGRRLNPSKYNLNSLEWYRQNGMDGRTDQILDNYKTCLNSDYAVLDM